MKKPVEGVFLAWFIVAVTTSLFYAFTGIPVWSKIGEDGYIRAMLLTVFYIAGFMVYPISKMPR